MPPPLAFLPVTSRALPKINGRVYAPASSVQALQKSYILQSYCFAWHNVRWGCYVKLALRAHTSRWSVTTPPHPPLITVLASLALSLNPPLGPGGPAVKCGLLCRVRAGTQGRAHPPHLFNPYGLAHSFGNSLACVGRATPHSLRSFVKQGASARPARASFRGGLQINTCFLWWSTRKIKRLLRNRNIKTTLCQKERLNKSLLRCQFGCLQNLIVQFN